LQTQEFTRIYIERIRKPSQNCNGGRTLASFDVTDIPRADTHFVSEGFRLTGFDGHAAAARTHASTALAFFIGSRGKALRITRRNGMIGRSTQPALLVRRYFS
jgi:hypothetical protein